MIIRFALSCGHSSHAYRDQATTRSGFNRIALAALHAVEPATRRNRSRFRQPSEMVERFAALIKRTNGRPTAAQLRREYLERGSFGIQVFTPGRNIDAEHLATAIAKIPSAYTVAIERCLPWAKDMTADLRSIHLGFHGAIPEASLPQIYIVVGAGTSGGTAEPGAQVLVVEVLCRIAPTQEAFRRTMRHFFAHETVHAFQREAGLIVNDNSLLTQVS